MIKCLKVILLLNILILPCDTKASKALDKVILAIESNQLTTISGTDLSNLGDKEKKALDNFRVFNYIKNDFVSIFGSTLKEFNVIKEDKSLKEFNKIEEDKKFNINTFLNFDTELPSFITNGKSNQYRVYYLTQRLGIFSESHTSATLLYNLQENKIVNNLYSIRVSPFNNENQYIVWGREKGTSSELLIYYLYNNHFQEIKEGPIKKIFDQYNVPSESGGLLKNSIEWIINDNTYITYEMKDKDSYLVIHDIRANNIARLQLLNEYCSTHHILSRLLVQDLNRIYVIKFDNFLALFFFDYNQKKFYIVKSNVIVGSINDHKWFYELLTQNFSIRCTKNNLNLESEKKIISVSFEGEEERNVDGVIFNIYTQKGDINVQKKDIKSNLNQDFLNDNVYLNVNKDKKLVLEYQNPDISLSREFILPEENIFGLTDDEIVDFTIKPINNDFSHIRIENRTKVKNFILLKQVLKQMLPDTFDENKAENNVKTSVEGDQPKKSQEQNKKIKKWAQRILGILGVSTVAAFLWSWLKNNKTIEKQ